MKRFFVVDGHSHLFRAYHAVDYLSTSKGVPTHAVLILSTMLWKLLREEQPEYFGIAWDPPGPTFRDALYAEYKATRAAMPDDLVRQLPHVRRLFEALRVPVIEVPGFEADDVLATLVRRALEHDVEVVIVTGDKDLLQLVGPRVRVLSISGRTGEPVLYDEAKVRARWGVEPTQIADVLALMGDAIDNIPGVRGVGEKTAVKLIAQFGSVARLYDNLPLVAGKLRETLAAGRREALLSRELAVLNHEVPIAFDLEAFRRVEPDAEKLRALWMEMEFSRLLRELPASAPPPAGPPADGLDTREALAAYLAHVPTDAPLAVDWAGEARPPGPRLAGLGLFHPAAGAAWLEPGAGVPDFGGRRLIVHDGKALIERWLDSGAPAPELDDSAVAAYLLNSARSSYRLEEVCLDAFAECPPALPNVPAGPGGVAVAQNDIRTATPPGPAGTTQAGDAPGEREQLGARLGERARWLWRYWIHAAGELEALGLRPLYENIERPLVPVLAVMERHGIRVDPGRLEAFAKEL
ncbi:MAG: hypothetical protein HY614_08590, partial [Candidatus Rokubacteria bacterium]|nr:hypothetical protein [Candidatus Rokubacteria bacterium]